MRLTDAVFKTSSLKKFTNYKNPGYLHKVVRIPALKDQVKSRQLKSESAPCVNEMSRMMDCWKKSDFNQSACGKETQSFLQCMAAAEASQQQIRELAAKGMPMKGSRFRPSSQVNEMLAKYPQPESNLQGPAPRGRGRGMWGIPRKNYVPQ
ncbi:coiled-coil-helix-coiled-coil-helix domain-containing protein 1 [Aplysia californica]|uniref:Coiled-coil-helix-coiled-coil-helix domain-containing protein 1 n=1 Tax=Aplysia californica TaxID=6500 RepID=A0ABM0K9P9_APLCA|nr:coiled-coil-helix-coiled-coil-helix domain-containing protein 1 [Aplysia californica]XP_005112286.1 coiled-coil-helix-coiled-coil-helix domain-containing protein 1 [Aplysia californica]XP_035829311.1 coiled-coil-helix-coiled-coil-helix domain-containing protein 1 [Aplysia californica]XP_035829312.1 coiled-coil-helix-coiled-coil-helix domain-containing protein 1 [Aplysia californica]